DADRGLGQRQLTATDEAVALLATHSDGDARRALTVLEAAAALVDDGSALTEAEVRDALQRRMPRSDTRGEEHCNLISSHHKALRGSAPQRALYEFARMMEGGAVPMYIARRTIRFASDDIGLAVAGALEVAIVARHADHLLGSPDGDL